MKGYFKATVAKPRKIQVRGNKLYASHKKMRCQTEPEIISIKLNPLIARNVIHAREKKISHKDTKKRAHGEMTESG